MSVATAPTGASRHRFDSFDFLIKGILDPRAHLVAPERIGGIVGLLVTEYVLVRADPREESAPVPQILCAQAVMLGATSGLLSHGTSGRRESQTGDPARCGGADLALEQFAIDFQPMGLSTVPSVERLHITSTQIHNDRPIGEPAWDLVRGTNAVPIASMAAEACRFNRGRSSANDTTRRKGPDLLALC